MTKDNKFRIFAKTALLKRGWTVGELARRIGYPRRTVSAAINQAKHPYVIQSIARQLGHRPKDHGPLPARPARPEARKRLSA